MVELYQMDTIRRQSDDVLSKQNLNEDQTADWWAVRG